MWLLVVIPLLFGVSAAPYTAQAATGDVHFPTLTFGSQGDYVWDLQYRLKTLDLYQGSLDGQFGTSTQQAVKAYQMRYGLQPDGVVGAQTWRSLTRFTMNLYEVDATAHLVYGEARGEPFQGQVAVAAVVLNRVQSNQFPNRVLPVIFEPLAFTAVSDGQYHLKPDKEAYEAVFAAIKGWDPTGEALYYFNPDTATSAWIWSRTPTKRIGQHIFAL